MKKKRMGKFVVDFLRVNETATTTQIYEYIKSQIKSRRNGDLTKQELSGNLSKWCVKVEDIMLRDDLSNHKRKVNLWKLKDEEVLE
tara:strand:- start:623 stop:880 length:258 start_codon:yes stop_codon:yes gene_type:complete